MESSYPVPTPQKRRSSGTGAVLSFAIFIVCALGLVIFFYNQNQSLKKKLAEYQQLPMITNTPAPTPPTEILQEPTIASPAAGSKIKSPLTITGVVPAGWMFEGVFPIKILDSNQKILVSGQAKEVMPGSWQSGNPVGFTATLTFKEASGSGILVLENDNPSGDPANSKTFEVPITF